MTCKDNGKMRPAIDNLGFENQPWGKTIVEIYNKMGIVQSSQTQHSGHMYASVLTFGALYSKDDKMDKIDHFCEIDNILRNIAKYCKIFGGFY